MEPTLTLVEKTAFLKSVDVLSGIPTEALAEMATRAREMHVDPGEALFREGDANRGAFLVVEGSLELRKGKALVRIVPAGMAFGELWLGEGEPHDFTLIASEHSHVLRYTREDVIDAIMDFPEFGVAMVQTLALRVHELTTRTLELERLIGRLHATIKGAGLPMPDPREPDDTAASGEA